MQNIFDSHAHYDDEAFNDDREIFLSDILPSSGICGIINCGADLKSSENAVILAEKYPYIYAAVGIHPHEAKDFDLYAKNRLEKLIEHPKTVAVGEIGLDYHYDFSPRDKQVEVFEELLIMARDSDLPVIIHDRDAHAATLEMLKKYRPLGVVHCFSGSAEMAREIINLGMYIGIGGAVTFKNAKKLPEVLPTISLDRLLIETDAPYMAPVPFRGKRCDSTHINYTAEKIGELLNLNPQEVLNITAENAKKLFRI